RPTTFSDVIGQDHIVTTLRHALAAGTVHHAYLFCGPRGVGKTTTARLLAKAVNCLQPKGGARAFDPCNACASCVAANQDTMMDVFEIDAASNRGIDDVRALRDTIALAPVGG